MKLIQGLLITACVLLLSPTVFAQADDPAIGTWKANIAQSKFDPGPPLQSETRVHEAFGDGVKLTITEVHADGKTQTAVVTYKYDGKPVAANGPAWDHVAMRRVSTHELRGTYLRGGKVIGHSVSKYSKDGKTINYQQTYTASDGTKVHNVMVFDKQ